MSKKNILKLILTLSLLTGSLNTAHAQEATNTPTMGMNMTQSNFNSNTLNVIFTLAPFAIVGYIMWEGIAFIREEDRKKAEKGIRRRKNY